MCPLDYLTLFLLRALGPMPLCRLAIYVDGHADDYGGHVHPADWDAARWTKASLMRLRLKDLATPWAGGWDVTPAGRAECEAIWSRQRAEKAMVTHA